MRIWHSEAVGGPETLRLTDTVSPAPMADEVVVQVAACGINFPDSLIIRDLYQFKPERPFAPGGEIAGVVTQVGSAVTALAVGDRVIARTGWGGLAEEVAVAAHKCAPLPEGMSMAEGAAFLFTYLTSYHALVQRGRIAAGEHVLVLGAAGGTGIAAIEIAKALGATVVAACSSAEKANFARASGADAAIVYDRGPLDKDAARGLGQRFKEAGGARGFDIVYDPVGGDYAEPAFRALAWKGRYLVVGFTAGIPRLPFNLPLLKGAEIVGVFNGGLQTNEPAVAAQNVRDLVALFVAGRIRPRVSQVFSFADAPAAIAAIADRQALGKLVVQVGDVA
ncbi:NADPH2:quinone reductase [Sphingomonas guangdongensis]|uniref:NADPH2:quinone reductase n=1 Tax=Sphingomonas guangdongensis TaxID=1141890 RepID=A0A285QHD8_9SPHN|nr:NADPH:quinone oxidoreductase family protein [Sphingomonas guangdongensis]SOB79492.1 NADPH2:quinone reductase [Sphingomonas guangdongensis]